MEERKERENLRSLRDKYHLDDSSAGIVTREDIEDVVSRWTGVPMTSLKEEEMARLLRVEEELHKRVISQEKAISALSRAIRRSRAGLKNPATTDWKLPVPRVLRAWVRQRWRGRWRSSCSGARSR